MRKKLLLADDSVTIQRVMELTFADEPIDVVTVGDGASAIARLETEAPDVVLADIGMPGQDGYDVAMHVRDTSALAHIPVILLTGAFDPVDHARARAAGCAGVLVKPFDPQMLVARVRQLLEGRTGGAEPRSDLDTQLEAVPEAADAPGGHRATREPPTAMGVAPAATQVDAYFERLDRAFALLNTTAPDDGVRPVPTGTAGKPSIDPSSPTQPRESVVPGAPDARDAGPTELPVRDTAPPGVPAAARTAAPVPEAVPAGAFVRESAAAPATTPMPPRDGGPTLGDACIALLAIEQGQPAGDLASRWTPIVTPGLVEAIAKRIGHELSERIVRELAPGIVSDVAERLVRDEIARLKAVQ